MMHNLIEDEKQARLERRGINVAVILILLGGFFLYWNWKKD
jgi:hypothetical protein